MKAVFILSRNLIIITVVSVDMRQHSFNMRQHPSTGDIIHTSETTSAY